MMPVHWHSAHPGRDLAAMCQWAVHWHILHMGFRFPYSAYFAYYTFSTFYAYSQIGIYTNIFMDMNHGYAVQCRAIGSLMGECVALCTLFM
jgi:hypothetical protein